MAKGTKPMLTSSHNIPYDDDSDLIGKPYKKGRKGMHSDLLSTIVSPTAVVVDDDL